MTLAGFFSCGLLALVHARAGDELDQLLEAGRQLRIQARYAQAEKTLREAEPLVRVLPESDLRRAIHANDLANVLTWQGRPAEAAAILEPAVAAARKSAPERYVVLALSLAAAYHQQGRARDAETLLRRVLRESGAGSPGERATARSMLGRVSLDLGHLKAAERYCREALSEQERVLGPAHRETYLTVLTLAGLHGRSGRFREAERAARRAVEISLAARPAGHPDEAHGRMLLGAALRQLGRTREAREQFEWARTIFEKALGEAHPSAALTRYHLASLAADTGDLASARGLLTEALAATERALGLSHPQVAMILELHSQVLRRLGERELAMQARARLAEVMSSQSIRDRAVQIDIHALAVESR